MAGTNTEFLKVHHYKRRPGTSEVQLLRKTPYKAFCSQGNPTVFIREGKAFAENGQLFDGGIPGWVMEELKKMNAKALAKLGFKKEELNASEQPQEAPQETREAEEASQEEPEQQQEAPEPSTGDVQGMNEQEGLSGVLEARRSRRR